MKYEIIVTIKGNEESFLTDEYKLVRPTGRLGHTIEKEDREVTEIKFKPLGMTRNKIFTRSNATFTIKEAMTGRNIATYEKYRYDSNGNSLN